jgi:hypothetical protein
VADNVNVTLGRVFTNTRPYFYAQGLSMGTMGSGLTAAVVGTVTQSSDTVATSAASGMPPTGLLPNFEDASSCVTDPKKALTTNCGNYAPVLTIPQDIMALAPPNPGDLSPADANAFENSYPHLRLLFGTAPSETMFAQKSPFNMQLTPFNPNGGGGGILVWQNQWFDASSQLWKGQQVPEGNNVPNLWPLVVLQKLVDDPGHMNDPASLQVQGDATHPLVIMQGITLLGGAMASDPKTDTDSLLNTVEAGGYPGPPLGPPNTLIPNAATGDPHQFLQDHLTVMLRPAVFCFDTLFDATKPDKRGNIVTPYLTGASATPGKNAPIVPLNLLQNDGTDLASVSNLIKPPPNYVAGMTSPAIQGCLPTGRYSINVVYPNGQAWTVPNEIGACTGDATGEGGTVWTNTPIPTCTIQQRNVLRSQGPRAVVEITPAMVPAHCQGTSSAMNPGPVPKICLPM